jgi:hypothetical protein
VEDGRPARLCGAKARQDLRGHDCPASKLQNPIRAPQGPTLKPVDAIRNPMYHRRNPRRSCPGALEGIPQFWFWAGIETVSGLRLFRISGPHGR